MKGSKLPGGGSEWPGSSGLGPSLSTRRGTPKAAAIKEAPTRPGGEGEGRHTQGPCLSRHGPDTRLLATFVVMVPAARVVVPQHLRGLPGVEDVVHLVLLAPSQRLTHGLSGLVDVEVPGA